MSFHNFSNHNLETVRHISRVRVLAIQYYVSNSCCHGNTHTQQIGPLQSSQPVATQCRHKNYSIIILGGDKSGSNIEEDTRFKTQTIWAHKFDVSIQSWLKKQTHKLRPSSFKKARSWELQEIKLTITVILLKMNFCLFPTFQVTSEDSFQFSLHINDNELGAL